MLAVQIVAARERGERRVQRLLAEDAELEENAAKVGDRFAGPDFGRPPLEEIDGVIFAAAPTGQHERSRELAVGHVHQKVDEGRLLEQPFGGRSQPGGLRHGTVPKITELVARSRGCRASGVIAGRPRILEA